MESRRFRHIRRATLSTTGRAPGWAKLSSRGRAPSSVVASLAVVVLLGLSLGAMLVPRPVAAQLDPGDRPRAEELVPDLILVVSEGEVEDPEVVRDRLASIDGVASVAVDAGHGTEPMVHLALAEASGRARPLDVIQARAEDLLGREVVAVDGGGEPAILAGGAGPVDSQLSDLFNRNEAWVVWAALAVGGALGLVFGLRRGSAAALGLTMAVLAAGRIGQQVAGDFDGTLATTGLPATLAGLVTGVALTYRLLIWFRHSTGTEGATRIEQAVADLAPELVLITAGGVATALVVDLLDPGRSAVTVALVGAAVAAVVVLAVVTSLLTVFDDDGPGLRPELLPISTADGRDIPLVAVGLAALGLLIVSVAALGPVGGDLYGLDDLDGTGEVAQVAAAQARTGGDPTAGLVAVAPEGIDPDGLGRWAAAVAERPEVAWVDVGSRRLTASGEVEVDPVALLTHPELPSVAVIVPAVAPRPATGRSLTERIGEITIDGIGTGPSADGNGGTGLELLGPEAGAAGSRAPILTAVALLASSGGAAVLALTGNGAVAALAVALRLLTGGATVGIHHLVSGDPSTSSALTALVAVGIGSMMAELELVRRVDIDDDLEGSRPRPSHRDPVPGPAGANLGQFGTLGLAALAFAGLVTLVVGSLGGGPDSARLGVALIVAAVIEVIVGIGILRPALLAQSASYHTVARPFRVAVHGRSTGDPENETPPDDDPRLREAVIDLVQAEFWMQAEPDEADLDLVFESDTPVHRQAAQRHASLVGAGLRVVGRSPELRVLRTVRDRSPVIVTVTVDHPECQLLDPAGRVVGVRHPERRVGRLWLAPGADGAHRIVESIELGSIPLTEG